MKEKFLIQRCKRMLRIKVVNEKEPISEEWSVQKVAEEYPSPGWEEIFKDAKNEIADVSDILEEDRKNYGKWLPNNVNLFRALTLTPLKKVKVVIFGQDPYHTVLPNGKPQATGMAFSVPRGAPIPPSLKNIYKEMKQSLPDFTIPKHGDLTTWALQGVLLLNSSLTVRESSPGCHKEIWYGFLKKIVRAVLDANPNCVFVAWGKSAQKVAKKFIGERATILEGVHPSGLSAHRGFFGCNHFVEINNLLIASKQDPIDWTL